MNNLNLLEVINYPTEKKRRYGRDVDGGYVIAELDTKYDCYISCGISGEESFTRDFLNKNNYLQKPDCYGFDGTIGDYPWEYTRNINFIKKNIGFTSNDHVTNLEEYIKNYNNIFMKMDIEGGEYAWLLSVSEENLKRFNQIVIEFHGLCGTDDWSASYKDKVKCLEKLFNTHYIIHAHGNNHGYTRNDIPEVLELTYLNKRNFNEKPTLNLTHLPIKYLDYPNNNTRPDIILNKYPFAKYC